MEASKTIYNLLEYYRNFWNILEAFGTLEVSRILWKLLKDARKLLRNLEGPRRSMTYITNYDTKS